LIGGPRSTLLKRDEVLKWFDGKKEFMRFYEDVLHTDDMLKYIIE